MKNFIRNLLLALFPLAVGVGIYLALHARNLPVSVPTLVFSADSGFVLLVVSGLVSLFLLIGVVCWSAAGRRATGQREADAHAAEELARLAAEEVRQTGEEARRRFIRQLDHALKNPLTGLRAALTNLSVDSRGVTAASNAGASNALADAHHQVNRLSRIVGDLRKLAELEERPFETDPVDLADVLAETVGAICALPQYDGRTVNCVISRVPWPLPPITGDRDLLGLAFYNLIENALKYTQPGDLVEVRAVEEGGWLVVDIADSGPGIAEEDMPHVFDELFRGANARGLEGSGLGLALVRRVVERHQGVVTVRSRHANQKGTVFRVRLPVKASAADMHAADTAVITSPTPPP